MKYDKLLRALIMLGALALFLIAGSVFAGEATISFQPVTKRTDGTTITGAVTYRYEVGTCPSLATINHTQTIAATTYTVTLPPGTYCARVFAIEAGGGTSGPSNIASKTIVIAPPESPVITISSVTYSLQSQPNGSFRLVRAEGRVPLGIPCEPIPSDWILGMAEGKLALCWKGG